MLFGLMSKKPVLGSVSFRASSNSTGYDTSCPEPTGTVNGDLLVAFAVYFDNLSGTCVLSGTGWTSRLKILGPTGGNLTVMEVFTKQRSGAQGATSATLGGGAVSYLLSMYALIGANQSAPISAYTSYVGMNQITLPGVAVANSNSLLVACQGCYNEAATSYSGTGLTFTHVAGPAIELTSAYAAVNSGTTANVAGAGGGWVGSAFSNSAAALMVFSP